MRRLSLVILLVSFMTSSAFAASVTWEHQIGQWNEAYRWSDGFVPDGSKEVKIKKDDSVCVLSSSQIWSDTSYNRMRVYEGATLMITDGGELVGPGWLRVGSDKHPGTVYQTGGLLQLHKDKDNSRLVIADKDESTGSYTISGGTITYDSGDGQLIIGDRGGAGTFTVFGSGSVIQMGSLHVGGREAGRGASGTLECLIDKNGVTPIQVSDVTLDPDGDSSTAALIVDLIDVSDDDLMAEYLLVDNTGSNPVSGIFDGMPEMTVVTLTIGSNNYDYYLTYVGGVGGNDIMLIPEPATLALLGLGSLIAIRRRKK